MRLQLSILLLSYAVLALSVSTTTTYYIDTIPAYSELPACALDPVRVIVKTMSEGCGDGGKYTSYNCFCSSAGSSSKFDSIISSSVAKQCTADTGGIVSASAIFHSYCLLGGTATTNGVAMNTSVPTGARPGSSSALVGITSTSSRASRTSSGFSVPTTTTAAAVSRSRPGTYLTSLTMAITLLVSQL